MSKRPKKDKPASHKAEPVAYNLTPHGALIRLSGHQEKVVFFDQKMVGYEKQLRTMDADYAYTVALGKIQHVMDDVALHRRPPISCKAGCGACCHQKVDLGAFEGTLLQNHLSAHKISVDKERLAKQAAALKNESFQQLSYEERRCVFLGEDQSCSIYSARPLMCRRHFVQNDPALCRTEDVSRLLMDVNPDTDAYLSAYVTRNAVRSLPEFVQESCLSLVQLKPSHEAKGA